MFLVLLTYKKPLTEVDRLLTEHRAYLEHYYQQGCLIVSGSTQPRTGGVILTCVSERERLEQILQEDPFYLHQIADYEIIPFSPSKYAAQFADFVKISEGTHTSSS